MHSKRCMSKRCFNPNHLTRGTRQENMDTARELGSMKGPGDKTAGEKNGRAVLTQAKVTRVRELYAQGLSDRKLAKQFGVGRTTVQRIVNGETWKHVPMILRATQVAS